MPETVSRLIAPALLVLRLGIAPSCRALVAAGTAGGVIADEGLNENDGEFDPLENTEVGREIYE